MSQGHSKNHGILWKLFAVISKHYTEDKYSHVAKLDKSIDLWEKQKKKEKMRRE